MKIYVYAGWIEDALIGVLNVVRSNGKETISFEYSDSWLNEYAEVLLDPDISSFSGRQYLSSGKSLFGMLSDVCPDRWGRKLIQRREEIQAYREHRVKRHLYEMDYLMAIADYLRTGGLRFKTSPDGDFVLELGTFDVPPVTELRRLEQASLNYEFSDDPYEMKWFSQLVSPGSSLGGARPKANIKHTDGSLWIAKFPSKGDDIDVGAWEYVTHELAVMSGLSVPEATIEKFSSYGSTFMVKRFDRDNQKRIHFASAMTMLGACDGASEEYSYLDIAEFISSYSVKPLKDLEELFRRIAFSIAVCNHDDHLRNHGFLLGSQGWSLSPAYDINPSLDNPEYLSLNVSLDSRLSSFDVLQGTSEFYHLNEARGKEIISEVSDIVSSNWIRLARRSGITETEIKRMRLCFEK